MNDFNKIFWGFIFSATGIAFGWLLNQLGQWFRTRQEDKRHLKVVLFNLLETYFAFIRSDFDKILHKVTNKVFDLIPAEHLTEESKQFIQSIYSGIITEYLKPELLTEIKKLQNNYQNSVNTLASIDPLAAYYLSGKSDIIERFEKTQTWFNSLKQLYPNSENEVDKIGKKIMDIMKPDVLTDTLSDLEKDVRNIAWKISPYVWFQSIKAIKNMKRNTDEKLDKKINELFKTLNAVIKQTEEQI